MNGAGDALAWATADHGVVTGDTNWAIDVFVRRM